MPVKLPSVLRNTTFEFLNFVPDTSHYAFRPDIDIDPMQQDFIFSNTALYVVSKQAAEFVVQHIDQFDKIDLWFFDTYYSDIIKLGHKSPLIHNNVGLVSFISCATKSSASAISSSDISHASS